MSEYDYHKKIISIPTQNKKFKSFRYSLKKKAFSDQNKINANAHQY